MNGRFHRELVLRKLMLIERLASFRAQTGFPFHHDGHRRWIFQPHPLSPLRLQAALAQRGAWRRRVATFPSPGWTLSGRNLQYAGGGLPGCYARARGSLKRAPFFMRCLLITLSIQFMWTEY